MLPVFQGGAKKVLRTLQQAAHDQVPIDIQNLFLVPSSYPPPSTSMN